MMESDTIAPSVDPSHDLTSLNPTAPVKPSHNHKNILSLLVIFILKSYQELQNTWLSRYGNCRIALLHFSRISRIAFS